MACRRSSVRARLAPLKKPPTTGGFSRDVAGALRAFAALLERLGDRAPKHDREPVIELGSCLRWGGARVGGLAVGAGAAVDRQLKARPPPQPATSRTAASATSLYKLLAPP